jgi:hypothetical protein
MPMRRAAAAQIAPGTALLGLALVTGLVVRLAPILVADFPLMDGGLFVTMARDIRHAGFGLPEFSTYNAGNVPFAYPPLGLCILALVPGDPISTERWLPLVWSILAIPAAYLLARELVDELRAGLTALLFAAMPVAWAIEGGGVTRALAFALLLFALWRVAVLVRSPGFRNAAVAGLLGAMAVLAHPQVGPAGLASGALLLAATPSRRGVLATVVAGVVALAITSPWLALIVSRYGWESIGAAASSHPQDDALGRLLTFGPSGIGTMDFILPLGLLGTVVLLRRREWLFPAWVLAMLIVPGGEGRYAAVAWALLAATGAAVVAKAVTSEGALKLAAAIGFAWLFVVSLGAGYRLFPAIPPGVREAMAEVQREAPAQARFAVFANAGRLEHSVLDWFPTLARRVSIGTFMGLEWTTSERWSEVLELSHRIERGEIPPDADFVFTVDGSSARWRAAGAD